MSELSLVLAFFVGAIVVFMVMYLAHALKLHLALMSGITKDLKGLAADLEDKIKALAAKV